MCQELSGIFTKRGELVTDDSTCHHEMLIASANLREGCRSAVGEPNFIRWEYVPVDGDWTDCILRIDETMIPGWLDAAKQDDLLAQCEAYKASLVVTPGKYPAMLGKKCIIKNGTVEIEHADMCCFLVGKGATLKLGAVRGRIVFGDVGGSVTTGFVYRKGSVTTGLVDRNGSVTTGPVGGSVTTGPVYRNGSVTTGDIGDKGSVTTGDIDRNGSVTTGDVGGSVTTGDLDRDGSVTTGLVGGSVTTGYVDGSVLILKTLFTNGLVQWPARRE